MILERPRRPQTEISQKLQEILNQRTDIYINLLRGNHEETPFRIKFIKIEIRDRKARLDTAPE